MEKLGNYYNSDLNKYIGKELPKVMTSIDLDLLQVKKARKIVRLAEYKHDKERVGYQQNQALIRLGKFAKVINENSELFEGWQVQVLMIRGNPPFDKLEINDYSTDKQYTINDKKTIKDFLCLNKQTK